MRHVFWRTEQVRREMILEQTAHGGSLTFFQILGGSLDVVAQGAFGQQRGERQDGRRDHEVLQADSAGMQSDCQCRGVGGDTGGPETVEHRRMFPQTVVQCMRGLFDFWPELARIGRDGLRETVEHGGLPVADLASQRQPPGPGFRGSLCDLGHLLAQREHDVEGDLLQYRTFAAQIGGIGPPPPSELPDRPGHDPPHLRQHASHTGNFQQGQQFGECALEGLVMVGVVEIVTAVEPACRTDRPADQGSPLLLGLLFDADRREPAFPVRPHESHQSQALARAVRLPEQGPGGFDQRIHAGRLGSVPSQIGQGDDGRHGVTPNLAPLSAQRAYHRLCGCRRRLVQADEAGDAERLDHGQQLPHRLVGIFVLAEHANQKIRKRDGPEQAAAVAFRIDRIEIRRVPDGDGKAQPGKAGRHRFETEKPEILGGQVGDASCLQGIEVAVQCGHGLSLAAVGESLRMPGESCQGACHGGILAQEPVDHRALAGLGGADHGDLRQHRARSEPTQPEVRQLERVQVPAMIRGPRRPGLRQMVVLAHVASFQAGEKLPKRRPAGTVAGIHQQGITACALLRHQRGLPAAAIREAGPTVSGFR
ncbi:hypothetical protein MCA1395 [Methylococcus capsulatus str. Bath]|uniref:Uncharacterized protein n=1 Tax=Methylococcus capsulatus (strain ATCC 33009 / NCIMB 11132 / Bath) TaxID=243233 RepID=Q608U4_METCA|nr:hypothetical protein MCA1395 [Methylococcus capsulatus str. Bath]